jgi:hypothetical protein
VVNEKVEQVKTINELWSMELVIEQMGTWRKSVNSKTAIGLPAVVQEFLPGLLP